MKTLISLVMTIGLVASAPSFAENPYGSGAGKASQEQIQHQNKTGQGAMEQERHREQEHKEVGKENGKGAEQGMAPDQKQEKKWWKFWE